MYKAFIIKSLEAYLTVYELALANGKKPGESMQEEFESVSKEHPEWFEFIGDSELDADMLTGEFRDRGLKVINIQEIDRGKKDDPDR